MDDGTGNNAQEDLLRAHIHGLLYEYSLTHLTTDYLAFTRDLTYERLYESLKSVPEADPNSLKLPIDPFNALSKIYALDALQPYEEKGAASVEAIHHLRDAFALAKKEPTTKSCWTNPDYWLEECTLHRPMTPLLLTSRARRETIILGQSGALKSIPKGHQELDYLRCLDMDEFPDPVDLKLEECLNLRPAMDAATQKDVFALLKSVPSLSRAPVTPYEPPCVTEFLCSDSSPIPFPTRTITPPIFSSRTWPGNARLRVDHLPFLASVADLPDVLPPITHVPADDENLYTEHMIVVDGWHAYQSSSPAPSGPSDVESDVDQLAWPSSPDTEVPMVRALADAEMDHMQVPRSERIGTLGREKELIGKGESLAKFLAGFAPPIAGITSELLSNISTAGEIGSGIDQIIDTAAEQGGHTDIELDAAIGGLYSKLGGEDPRTIVYEEPLIDNEEERVRMDITLLPDPPSLCVKSPFTPTNFAMLAVRSNAADGTWAQAGFLKKVKGTAALNLELSWVPFKFGSSIPTDADAANVTSLYDPDEMDCHHDPQHLHTTDDNHLLMWDDYDAMCEAAQQWNVRSNSAAHTSDIILTREERRRVAGLANAYADTEPSSGNGLQDEAPEGIHMQDTPHIDTLPTTLIEFGPGASANEATRTPDERVHARHCVAKNVYDDSGIGVHRYYGDYVVCDFKENLPPSDDFDLSEDSFEGPPLAGFGAIFSEPPPVGGSQGRNDFVPLSFDSHHIQSSQLPPQDRVDVEQEERARSHLKMDWNNVPHQPRPPSSPPKPRTAVGLVNFAALRARQLSLPAPEPTAMIPRPAPVAVPVGIPATVPEEVMDRHTIRMPQNLPLPTKIHRYFASLELVQKRVLVRALEGRQCSADLVERSSLQGVDIVQDPHTAVIFSSLLSLPYNRVEFGKQICMLSWRFSRILIVFEAYPPSHAKKVNSRASLVPYAFTPPIVTAIQKFKRDLSIAEGCGSKTTTSDVHCAFALSVEEAAIFARAFGDYAENQDITKGVLWDDRKWLDLEEQQDEAALAGTPRMNVFAAFIMLSSEYPIDTILNATAAQRLQEFSALLGEERIHAFNEYLAQSNTNLADASQVEVGPMNSQMEVAV